MRKVSDLDHKTAAAINRNIGEALRDHLDADYAALPAQLRAKLAELQRAEGSSARPDGASTARIARPGLAASRR